MMRAPTWRRVLIVAVVATALVLPWAPAAQAIGGPDGDSVERSTPSFDLWDWLLQLFGISNGTVSAASTDDSTEEATPEEPIMTLGPTPEGLLDGGTDTGDDDGDIVAGIDPEG